MRKRCVVCKRFYHPNEICANLCAYCWKDRSDAYMKGIVNLGEFSDGEVYRCFQCKHPIIFGGYMQWVRDANTFALHCIKCSDAKVRTDDQYRDTPFARSNRLQ